MNPIIEKILALRTGRPDLGDKAGFKPIEGAKAHFEAVRYPVSPELSPDLEDTQVEYARGSKQTMELIDGSTKHAKSIADANENDFTKFKLKEYDIADLSMFTTSMQAYYGDSYDKKFDARKRQFFAYKEAGVVYWLAIESDFAYYSMEGKVTSERKNESVMTLFKATDNGIEVVAVETNSDALKQDFVSLLKHPSTKERVREAKEEKDKYERKLQEASTVNGASLIITAAQKAVKDATVKIDDGTELSHNVSWSANDNETINAGRKLGDMVFQAQERAENARLAAEDLKNLSSDADKATTRKAVINAQSATGLLQRTLGRIDRCMDKISPPSTPKLSHAQMSTAHAFNKPKDKAEELKPTKKGYSKKEVASAIFGVALAYGVIDMSLRSAGESSSISSALELSSDFLEAAIPAVGAVLAVLVFGAFGLSAYNKHMAANMQKHNEADGVTPKAGNTPSLQP